MNRGFRIVQETREFERCHPAVLEGDVVPGRTALVVIPGEGDVLLGVEPRIPPIEYPSLSHFDLRRLFLDSLLFNASQIVSVIIGCLPHDTSRI